MKVIVTENSVEIYREDLNEAPGNSCREFAEWSMAWASRRLAEEIGKSIEKPGSSNSALAD